MSGRRDVPGARARCPDQESARGVDCTWVDNRGAISGIIVHIRTTLKTASEINPALADRIRARRVSLRFPYLEGAQRAGVASRTWRRLETQGKASIEVLIRAAIALRCEEALDDMFPAPSAHSMDELLARQAKAARSARPSRSRVARRQSV